MAVPLVLASSLHALGRVADAEAMLCDGLAVGPPGRGRAVALQCRPPTSHHNLIILCYGRMITIFGVSLAEAATRPNPRWTRTRGCSTPCCGSRASTARRLEAGEEPSCKVQVESMVWNVESVKAYGYGPPLPPHGILQSCCSCRNLVLLAITFRLIIATLRALALGRDPSAL